LFHELDSVLRCSYINDDGSDHGLDDDEGDPDSLNQLPAPEIIELWQLKVNSYARDNFSVQSPAQGTTILITPKPANVEPDLQYVIYVSFPYKLAAPIHRLGLYRGHYQKPSSWKDNQPSSQSLSVILASHRDVMNARPEIVVGAYKHGSQTRIFPQHRQENYIETSLRETEPHRTFFVIVDRPGFLTAPHNPQLMFEYERSDCWVYQVWRSIGMPEVAGDLAIFGLEN
ncbi:hypothetical protein DPV78_006839, partial [Talaromyces pinophilus]